jgi:hypothetical protein
MENWQIALVVVIFIITIWNLGRFVLGHKNGALQSYGVSAMMDNDVDVVVSSLGLLLMGMALGAVGSYANFGKDLLELPSKLTKATEKTE